MDKWRLVSDVSGDEEFIISSIVPTECPSGDAIKDDSAVIIQKDVLIRDGSPVNSLADLKQLRYNEINGKTAAFIDAGFSYESKPFSLSIFAMIAYEDMQTNHIKYAWPYTITTKDYNEYSLTAANRDAFIDLARTTVKDHKDDGRGLLKAIYDAIDEAAVDAIIDTR